MNRSGISYHRSVWLSVLLGLALVVGSLLPGSLVFAQKDSAPAAAIDTVFDTTLGVPQLGEALGFGIFNVTGQVAFAGGNTTVTGSIGVGPGATAEIGGTNLNALNGDIVIDPDSGDGDFAGLQTKAQDVLDSAGLSSRTPVVAQLDQAYADARALYLAALALAPTQTFPSDTNGATYNITPGAGTPTLTVIQITGSGVGGLGDLKGDFVFSGGDKDSYVVIQAAKIGDNTGWTLGSIPYEHVIYAVTESYNGNGGSVSGTVLGVPLADGLHDGDIELKTNNQNSPVYGRMIGRVTQWVSGANTRGWDFGDLPESLGYTTLASTVIRQGGENRTVDGLLPSPNGIGTANLYPVTSGYYPATLGGAANIAATQQGPSHLISKDGGQPNISKFLLLGDIMDMEPNGQPNLTATGDNATADNYSDDEEGVTLPGSILPGGTATFAVRYINENADARLYAFVDWNGDGDFEDLNEKQSQDVGQTAGSHATTTYNFVFTVPTVAQGVSSGPIGARFRIATQLDDNDDPINLGPAGPAPNGEVEDYLVTVTPANTDWGDAPDTYGTLATSNGPRHTMVPGLTLGVVEDVEANGQPTADAVGDDNNGTSDDEDAVPATLEFTEGDSPSLTVEVTNSSGQAAYLQCWMDLNGNGVFDPSEASGQMTIPANGTDVYTVSFGALTTTGDTFLRCRLSLIPSQVTAPTGAASSGEVEDHLVTITVPDLGPRDWGDLPSPYPTQAGVNGARHKTSSALFMGVCLDAESDGQPNATATGDDLAIGAPTYGSCPSDEDGVTKVPGLNNSSWSVGTVAANLGGGLDIAIGAGTGVVQVFMDFDQNGTLDPMQLYYDHDSDSNTPVVAYTGTLLTVGSHTFYFSIPALVNVQTPVATRVRLSTTGGYGATGLAPNGEIEDYFFKEGSPLAVNLAAFEAIAEDGQVLVSWETVSEVTNAGFNLYRATSQDGERTLLVSMPSQAPGSTQGASYHYADAAVVAGQTYWYWLEDMDLSGATTLHGPVSVSYQSPTAVTLSGLTADTAAATDGLSWLLIVAGLAFALLLGVSQLRKAKQA